MTQICRELVGHQLPAIHELFHARTAASMYNFLRAANPPTRCGFDVKHVPVRYHNDVLLRSKLKRQAGPEPALPADRVEKRIVF